MSIASNENTIESLKSVIARLVEVKSEKNLMMLVELLDLPFFEVKTIVEQAIKAYSNQPYLKTVLMSKLNSKDPLFYIDLCGLSFELLDRSSIDTKMIQSLMNALPVVSEFTRKSIYKALMKLHGEDVYAFFHRELEKNIKNPDSSIIRFLGEGKYEPSFLVIFKLLDHPSISVLEATLDALFHYNNEVIIPKLIELLLSFKSLSLMKKILHVLSRFSTDEIFLAVIKCIYILELQEDICSILVNNYQEYISGTTCIAIYENLHPDLKKEILEFIFRYFESKTATITQEESNILQSIISFIVITKDPIYINYMSNFLCSENNVIATTSLHYFYEICSDLRIAKCINHNVEIIENPMKILNQFDEYQRSKNMEYRLKSEESISVSCPDWMKNLLFSAKIAFFRLFTMRNYDSNITVLFRVLDFLGSFRSNYIDSFILHHYIRLLCACDPIMHDKIHDLMISLLHKNNALLDAMNFDQVIKKLSNFHIESILNLLRYLSVSKHVKNNNLLYIYSTILKRNKIEYLQEILLWYFQKKYSIIDIFENLKVPKRLQKKMIIEILKFYKSTTSHQFKQMIKFNLSVLSANLNPTLYYNPILENIPDLRVQVLLLFYIKAMPHEKLFLSQLISYYELSEHQLKEFIVELSRDYPDEPIRIADFQDLFKYLREQMGIEEEQKQAESEILI